MTACEAGHLDMIDLVLDKATETKVAKQLVSYLNAVPSVQWAALRGRQTLRLGGEVTPGGLKEEPLPSSIAAICDAVAAFLPGCIRAPNHVLVNRYYEILPT